MGNKKILLDHGSGGKISHSLLKEMILPVFDNDLLARLDDGARIDIGGGIKIAFSTDSYVVDPIFFPGGNIGDLAVNGTVNDIAMCGGDPKYISAALILEEGFSVDDLKLVLDSMAEAARKAGVIVATGDTKVVPKGKVDKIFINTSGFGIIPFGVNLSGSNARPGDKVIISGTIADHGITILSTREGLKFDSDIKSDSAALNGMVKKILEIASLERDRADHARAVMSKNLLNSVSGSASSLGLDTVPGSDSELNPDTCSGVHVLRDPTRGGVGTTLNEIAQQSDVRINIWEDAIPVKDAVHGMCELLGFDPLYLANEGKLLAVVSAEIADRVLDIIKKDQFGKDAAIIGEVVRPEPCGVFLKTSIGGSRIVDMLTGDQLPRIC
ncbi:MAG: hydrogenase expression/formation protein HypE [Desulfamplus sp.]|nr:hydrogenase expression/formation protein HypE [Desulfamplus sp.]